MPRRTRLPGLVSAPVAYPPLENMLVWLDANAITGLSNGDPVTTWGDLSGLGNNAVQTDASYKPTYQTNVLNSLPGVKGDSWKYMDITGLSAQFGTSGSFYVVYSISPSQDMYGIAFLTPLGTGLWRYNTDGQAYMDFFRSTRLEHIYAAPNAGPYMHTIISNNIDNTYNIWMGRTNKCSTTPNWGISNYLRTFYDGGQWFSGSICELLLYKAAHSTEIMTRIWDYLTAKWNL